MNDGFSTSLMCSIIKFPVLAFVTLCFIGKVLATSRFSRVVWALPRYVFSIPCLFTNLISIGMFLSELQSCCPVVLRG